MKKYSSNKDLNKLIHSFIKHGWELTAHRKHLKLSSPKGSKAIISKSPSDYRAISNIKRQLKNL